MSLSVPSNATQGLLKRNASRSYEEFSKYYSERHGPLAMPWFLENNVIYYAQIHRPLTWASEDARAKYGGKISLDEWDAAAEVVIGDFSKNPSYYNEIILPDERNLLLSEALQHMEHLEPGSVNGNRIMFIAEGKAVVDYAEFRRMWEEHREQSVRRS